MSWVLEPSVFICTVRTMSVLSMYMFVHVCTINVHVCTMELKTLK